MNSDDEREVDIDSDEERRSGKPVDKRAHHNALERKRRDHIKESFSSLRDSIPTMKGDKSSRAQILKQASEYINFMRGKQGNHTRDLDDLKKQNEHIEAQIRALERAKTQGTFNSAQEVLASNGLDYEVEGPPETAPQEFQPVSHENGGEGGSGSDSDSGSQPAGASSSSSNHPSPMVAQATPIRVPSSGGRGAITVVQAGGGTQVFQAAPQQQQQQQAQQRTTTVTLQPMGAAGGAQRATVVQPGQSVLIVQSAEPAKKKFKQ